MSAAPRTRPKSTALRTRAFAARLFAWSLAVLPRHVRDRYAAEMQRTFDDRCAQAARRGSVAVALLAARELIDVGVAAAETRRPSRLSPRSTRMSAITQDLRHALRMLLRQRGFTGVAVLTLALGIGITTAVFTVVNEVLLRPLPLDRVVLMQYGDATGVSPWLSPLNYQDYVAQSGVFAQAAALTPTTGNLTGRGDPERVPGASVTPGFFDVLGVPMTLGRGFANADVSSGARVVVLSDGLWRRRFGAEPGVVGSTTTIDGEAHTIVGVAPPGVSYPPSVEFWTPLVFTPRDIAPQARGALFVQVVGRLKPGVSEAQATSALGTIASRFAVLYPATERGSVMRVTGLRDALVRRVRPTLRLLLLAVSLVLTIACANVAGLLLARGSQRGREIGVRAALGAGRWRLARQLFTESTVLGLLGAAVGVAIAYGLVSGLLAFAPPGVPRLTEARLDAPVLLFAVAVGLATSVAFGLVPAIFTVGGGALGALAGHTRAQVSAAGRRIRRALVASEIALAVVLLASGGLLLRSYDRLRQSSTGFDDRGVMTLQVSLPSQAYPDAASRDAFTSRLLAAVRARPGVELAAAAMGVPFGRDYGTFSNFRIGGGAPSNQPAALRLVSDDYFRTLAIPVRRGRAFAASDAAGSPEVAIVNERFAAIHFAGRDPIGQQILVSVSLARGARNGPKTIVGVAGDVKESALDETPAAAIYVPYAQQPVGGLAMLVKSTADPRALAGDLRRAVAAIDPTLPVANVKPLTELMDGSVAARRFAMLLVLLFAGVALALSAVGLYGALAYLVATRASEIGVRMALGAPGRAVVWLFLREGVWLTIAGLAAGIAGARVSSGLLASSLVGVTASDPPTLALVAATLGAVAVAAMAVPVWRATQIDPASLLRADS